MASAVDAGRMITFIKAGLPQFLHRSSCCELRNLCIAAQSPGYADVSQAVEQPSVIFCVIACSVARAGAKNTVPVCGVEKSSNRS